MNTLGELYGFHLFSDGIHFNERAAGIVLDVVRPYLSELHRKLVRETNEWDRKVAGEAGEGYTTGKQLGGVDATPRRTKIINHTPMSRL